MKTIIEMAREAGFEIVGTEESAFQVFARTHTNGCVTKELERFAALHRTAIIAELCAGVEIPKPDTHCWDSDTQSDVWSHSKDQLRETVAREALREREACAKVCETLGDRDNGVYGEVQIAVYSAAKSIRARGNK